MTPYIALFAWPIVVIWLFNKCRLPTALIWSILGGYLLLPEKIAIRLQGVPDIDKASVAAIPALIMALVMGAKSLRTDTPAHILPGLWPRHILTQMCLLLLLVSIVMVNLTNTEPLFAGLRAIRGLSVFDMFSSLMKVWVTLLPMLLARKYLASADEHRVLLKCLCVLGLCYSILALYEVRMSPVLNSQIYGYFQHSWAQHIRAGGFRPAVFLEHGLWVSIFFTVTCLAAVACLRIEDKSRRSFYILAALWLFGTLYLSKSLGAFMIALALIPPILLMGVRLQMIAAASIAVIILFYPTFRGAGVLPLEGIKEVVRTINPNRAESFRTRIDNEEILLARAALKPVFGWGGWGRSLVYNEGGRRISTPDGYWIIVVGEGGWVRYLAIFGMLTAAILILTLRQKAYEVTMATSALCLVLSANLTDLIPNGTITPLTWLIAGALLGRIETKSVAAKPAQSTRERSANALSAAAAIDGPISAREEAGQTARAGFSRQTQRHHRRVRRQT